MARAHNGFVAKKMYLFFLWVRLPWVGSQLRRTKMLRMHILLKTSVIASVFILATASNGSAKTVVGGIIQDVFDIVAEEKNRAKIIARFQGSGSSTSDSSASYNVTVNDEDAIGGGLFPGIGNFNLKIGGEASAKADIRGATPDKSASSSSNFDYSFQFVAPPGSSVRYSIGSVLDGEWDATTAGLSSQAKPAGQATLKIRGEDVAGVYNSFWVGNGDDKSDAQSDGEIVNGSLKSGEILYISAFANASARGDSGFAGIGSASALTSFSTEVTFGDLNVVPIPAALPLLATSVLGLACFKRWRHHNPGV